MLILLLTGPPPVGHSIGKMYINIALIQAFSLVNLKGHGTFPEQYVADLSTLVSA